MLHTDKLRVGDKEAENPWFHQLYIALGPRGERVCPGQPRVWHPPTDVYETDEQVTVKIEIAGVNEDDFVVRLHGRDLSVRGCRGDPGSKLAYQQMEISYGEFRSHVRLPCDVDEDKARARYDEGFLYVEMPKALGERKVPVVVVIEHES
jgi:HSP20 family molecular chaperone IbpA